MLLYYDIIKCTGKGLQKRILTNQYTCTCSIAQIEVARKIMKGIQRILQSNIPSNIPPYVSGAGKHHKLVSRSNEASRW